ncbi:MAG: hypothetical protein U0354_04255 [Candidatus Sericytochromatia bacterium]
MNKNSIKILIASCFLLASCQNNLQTSDIPLQAKANSSKTQKTIKKFAPNDISSYNIRTTALNTMKPISYDEISDIQENKDFSVIVFNYAEQNGMSLLPEQLVFIKKDSIEYQYRILETINIPGSNYCEPCSQVVANSSKMTLKELKDKLKTSYNSNPIWVTKLNKIYQTYFN